tara:strand:+ start:154 stop:822 length:669 start_codon:yes stop_codon:yes gene_type:complete
MNSSQTITQLRELLKKETGPDGPPLQLSLKAEKHIKLHTKVIDALTTNETIREELIVEMKSEIKSLHKKLDLAHGADNPLNLKDNGYGFHSSGSPRSKPFHELLSDLFNKKREENEKLKEEIKSLHIQKQNWEDFKNPDWGKKYALKIDYQKKIDEIETLEEKITCLESDSHNEVSLAEYEELKEENEEQLAAVECLKFMDYTYKDGRWMMDDEDEEEEEED